MVETDKYLQSGAQCVMTGVNYINAEKSQFYCPCS